MDVDSVGHNSSRTFTPAVEIKKHRKLTIKRIRKMTYDDLFGENSKLYALFKTVHNNIGSNGVCVMRKPIDDCSCYSVPNTKSDSSYLTDFIIGVVLQFTHTVVEEEVDEAMVFLRLQQCKAALQIVTSVLIAIQSSTETQNPSYSNSRHCQLVKALDDGSCEINCFNFDDGHFL